MFDWKKNLDLAEKLLANANLEEDFRNIVGRSYYSLFPIIESIVISRGYQYSKDKGSHIGICNFFSNSKINKHHARLALQLNKLRTKRTDSDYHSNVTITKTDAVDAIRWAKGVHTGLLPHI